MWVLLSVTWPVAVLKSSEMLESDSERKLRRGSKKEARVNSPEGRAEVVWAWSCTDVVVLEEMPQDDSRLEIVSRVPGNI